MVSQWKTCKYASQAARGKEFAVNAGDTGDAGVIPGGGNRQPTPVFLGFPSGSDSKESACNVEDLGRSLGWEDPLEKEMATHSSILAWEIPCTVEPGRVHGVTKSQTRLSTCI